MKDPKTVEYYKDDIYATQTTGIETVSAGNKTAVCSLSLQNRHRNARGAVMGGVIFTLADFTFTLAANVGSDVRSVSLDASINFLSSPKGEKLFAEAACIKDGANTCVYSVDITDDLNRHIARAQITGYKLTK